MGHQQLENCVFGRVVRKFRIKMLAPFLNDEYEFELNYPQSTGSELGV